MMMLEGPYDMIFQKGDSVALAVQNPVSIPQPCRSVTWSVSYTCVSKILKSLKLK